MHIMQFPSGLRRFALGDLPAQAWQNGGGVTREIGQGVISGCTNGQWDWRFSVADIETESRFSRFDGIERKAVLVDGEKLTLCGDETQIFDRIGSLHAFAGESRIDTKLGAGPVRLFNAMARRDAAAVGVHVHRGGTSVVTHDEQAGALLVAQGEFEVSLRFATSMLVLRLGPGDGVVLEKIVAELHLTATGPDACLLHATASPIA